MHFISEFGTRFYNLNLQNMFDMPYIKEEDRLKAMIEGVLKEEVGDSTTEEMRARVYNFLEKRYCHNND